MSDKSPTTAQRRPGVHVVLADDVLMPRREFAVDILGVTDKTAARMGLPTTTYLSNVAHVLKNESLRLVAARVRRPNQRRARGAA